MTIPTTRNGLDPFQCLSALQKCIRRGMEREAMQFAVELMHTSKAFHTMTCKRLQVISHEDCDTQARPDIVPFVRAACEQAREWYDSDVDQTRQVEDGDWQCDPVDVSCQEKS